jgi:hypothetical protein
MAFIGIGMMTGSLANSIGIFSAIMFFVGGAIIVITISESINEVEQKVKR